MSKQQIYLVYSCDEWKSTANMHLILATTSADRVRDFIAGKIQCGEMQYKYSDCMEAANAFYDDWATVPRYDINGSLEYGLVDYVYDGEEI